MSVDTETAAGHAKDQRYFWDCGIRCRCFLPSAVAAFCIHLGPFYFHVPFVGHHYRHHLHMRANPKEARPRPSDVSRGGSYAARGGNYATEQIDREALESCTSLAPGVTNLPIDRLRDGHVLHRHG